MKNVTHVMMKNIEKSQETLQWYLYKLLTYNSLATSAFSSFYKENLNASRPSEHPPVMVWEEMSKRLGGIAFSSYYVRIHDCTPHLEHGSLIIFGLV